MLSFSLTHQKSTVASNSGTGCSTKPSVALFDFSGFRFGLPPVRDMNCTAQLSARERPGSGLPWPCDGPGQRTGSSHGFAVFVKICAEFSSYSDGARKPVV